MKTISERMELRGQQGGFTLIELLVVIAILAILAGVAVFAVNGLTTDAGENACKVERDTIKTAQGAAEAGGGNPIDYIDGGETKYFSTGDSGVTWAVTAENTYGAACAAP